jgi:hypothetical protein
LNGANPHNARGTPRIRRVMVWNFANPKSDSLEFREFNEKNDDTPSIQREKAWDFTT